MIPTVEAWRNAGALGAYTVLLLLASQPRWARRWLAALFMGGLGLAFYLQALDRRWAVSSFVADAPWVPAVLLALWMANAESGWLRARSWVGVVLATVLLGDRLVAVGLAAAEPDPGRRARLVLAASGASLIGVTSGAAPLVLGWGGAEAVLVGLLMAGVGFAPGGGVERVRPDGKAAAAALLVPLLGAGITWLAILGGAVELVSQGLEQVPLLPFSHGELLVYAAAVLGAVVGDEGFFALIAREVELRALSLRGDTLPMAIRAGLAVGGGLPLLWMTGARLRVGLPLWLLQVAMVAGWLLLR
jgi:hypothetical protein